LVVLDSCFVEGAGMPLIALVDGFRATATKKARGVCPGCDAPLIAKVGKIIQPHWAHLPGAECSGDEWKDRETTWHLEWKARFPTDTQEFLRRDADGRKHIADVRLPFGRVIEFQHSSITTDTIMARESFWLSDPFRVCWLLDARSWPIEEVPSHTLPAWESAFWWSHVHRVWRVTQAAVFLDLGEDRVAWAERFELGDKSRRLPSGVWKNTRAWRIVGTDWSYETWVEKMQLERFLPTTKIEGSESFRYEVKDVCERPSGPLTQRELEALIELDKSEYESHYSQLPFGSHGKFDIRPWKKGDV
jgi:hypothetical protein